MRDARHYRTVRTNLDLALKVTVHARVQVLEPVSPDGGNRSVLAGANGHRARYSVDIGDVARAAIGSWGLDV